MTNPLPTNQYLLITLSVIFLFLMHVFIPNMGGVLALPMEYFIWVGIGAVIFLGIVTALEKKSLVESPFKIYILLFAVSLLASSIFNPIKNMNMFVISSVRLMAGIILWLALLQFNLSNKEKVSTLLIIFVSAVIESIIGIMQFFGLHRYIPITPAPNVGIVGGAFQQQNLFASWIATGVVISLHLITTNRFKNFSMNVKTLFWLSMVLLSLNLVIASSRTGLLGVILGMVVILPTRKRHYFIEKKNLIIWFMAFIIGVSGGFYMLPKKDKLAIKNGDSKTMEWFPYTRRMSDVGRVLMYKTSLQMFKEKPLFGQGFSNFGSLYMYYQAEVKKGNKYYKDVNEIYVSHPHNEIFLILSETGIMGFLGLLILIYGFIKIAIKYGKERMGLYIALLTPITIHTLVEYPLQLSTAHFLLFIILVYMATAHFLKSTQLKLSTHIANLLIIIVSGVYIFFATYTIETFNAYIGLVRWHIDYTETGRGSAKDIEPSTKNLYLKNWSVPMYMFAKAEDAIKDIDANKEFLEDFLKWSNYEKQRLPIFQVFYYDANVLLSMGIHYKQHIYFDEAMNTVEQGLLLYPDNEALKNLKIKIAAEAIKTLFGGPR